GPKGQPLFRICIDVTEAADASGSVPAEFALSPFETGDAVSGCDLYVSFAAGRETLRGMVMYSTELFDRGTVSALLDRLQALLDSLPGQVDGRVAEAHA